MRLLRSEMELWKSLPRQNNIKEEKERRNHNPEIDEQPSVGGEGGESSLVA